MLTANCRSCNTASLCAHLSCTERRGGYLCGRRRLESNIIRPSPTSVCIRIREGECCNRSAGRTAIIWISRLIEQNACSMHDAHDLQLFVKPLLPDSNIVRSSPQKEGILLRPPLRKDRHSTPSSTPLSCRKSPTGLLVSDNAKIPAVSSSRSCYAQTQEIRAQADGTVVGCSFL